MQQQQLTRIMYCRQCGNAINENLHACNYCGTATGVQPMMPMQVVPPVMMIAPQKSRVAYVLLGLFLGGLGIHNFYAGYIGRAIAQLLITLFLFWTVITVFAVGIWVLVEVCAVTKDSRNMPFN